MAHLTNFSFEFFYEIFTEDASLLLLYHGAKKSKMTKNSNQGGPALRRYLFHLAPYLKQSTLFPGNFVQIESEPTENGFYQK